MSDLPGGTVTFLFTDIEGSTRLWEQRRKAMRTALSRHDALLNEVIVRHQGHVFKTVGDAFCAAFAIASDALAATLSLQRALQQDEWQDPPLRVRMALHTGAAQQRDGDYFGPPLNRVARLLAIGHGGQVLLSLPAAELVRGSLPQNAHLKDLGSHRLRDLTYPEQVFQLMHPDLPVDFPPLKSLDALATNLPMQLTSFIGREKEMAEVKRLLGTTRLLTLTGSGGCGKTRLALQVAVDLVEEFPDGVWFVDLSSLSESSLVPQMVASALGVPEEPGRTRLQTLVDYLKARSVQLVLDNCEHLIEACAQLADTLLRSCPQLRILATSREGMGIAGEVIYRVPSLTLPDPNQLPPIEAFIQFEAVGLFLERASLKQSTFAITRQNAAAVAQVCRRLDGIPLAIELAAARVSNLSIEQIAQFDDYFRLLTRGSRTAPNRQQTLVAAIDWSYDLLSVGEQTLLCRLSVFAGGWTLNAAERVCSDTLPSSPNPFSLGGEKGNEVMATNVPPRPLWERGQGGEGIQNEEVLDLLTSLVDKSLVLYDEQEGQGRYRLLETVRRYASQRLERVGEVEETRDRHLRYCLQLAETAETKLQGPEQAEWLQRLEREHDNLRAGLAWAVEGETRLRLAGALWRFWYRRGYLSEGRSWLENALSKSSEVVEQVRAKALHGAGVLAWSQGDYAAARTFHEDSLALRRQVGDEKGMAVSLNNLGNVARSLGDDAAARSYYEQSLDIRRKVGDQASIASSLNNLGMMARDRADYITALHYFEDSLVIYRELEDAEGIAMALLNLGTVHTEQGNYAAGQGCYEESLAIRRKLGNKLYTAMLLYNLGDVARKQGDNAAALALFRESLSMSHELGNREIIILILVSLAGIAATQRNYQSAARLLGAEESLRLSINARMESFVSADYEWCHHEIQSELDEEKFKIAWEEGHDMSLDDVIDYALQQAGTDI